MRASGRVGEMPRWGGRARATGGGRVRVGGVGSDWWDGSYWGGKGARAVGASNKIYN